MEKPDITVGHSHWQSARVCQAALCSVAPILDVSLASIAFRDLTLVFLPGRLQMLESLQMSFSNLSYFDRI